MRFFQLIIAAAVVCAAAKVNPQEVPPNEGDVTHTPTEYELYLYSQPNYRGHVYRLAAHECGKCVVFFLLLPSCSTNIPQSPSSSFTLPLTDSTDHCDHLHKAQRIVGNVHDINVWGFPDVRAVKCLSHSACRVIKAQACDLNRKCYMSKKKQGRCPFDSNCAEYHPVLERDWHFYQAPDVLTEDGYYVPFNPIKEYFHVDENGLSSFRPHMPKDEPDSVASHRHGGSDKYPPEPYSYDGYESYDEDDDLAPPRSRSQRIWDKIKKWGPKYWGKKKAE